MAPMNVGRTYFALVRYEGVIYAVGGYLNDTVEAYSEVTNKWEMTTTRVGWQGYQNAAAAIDAACVYKK